MRPRNGGGWYTMVFKPGVYEVERSLVRRDEFIDLLFGQMGAVSEREQRHR
jgi:hypothetical protein